MTGRLPQLAVAVLFCLVFAATATRAQTDEIHVYNAEINQPGQFSVTLHNNYTPIGRKEPAFPGGIVPNHSLNGVPEYAYGVKDWLELGMYLPTRFEPANRQEQAVFAVVDYGGAPLDVEFGVGHGFTAASDPLILKLILTRSF